MRATLLLLALLTAPAPAQWTLQQSHTTASLRGIHAVSDQIAWASGTSGTVLHTTDGGAHWLPCAVPPQAEHLDFRGVQAFDAQTAIVMSSGKGDLSRLYKTTDACQTWHLVFTNPDPEGFWDAVSFSLDRSGPTERCFGQVIGDPVDGYFAIFVSMNCGDSWERQIRKPAKAKPGEALFAASNSSQIVSGPYLRTFVTGGNNFREFDFWVGTSDYNDGSAPLKVLPGARPVRFVTREWLIRPGPTTNSSESSGAFSVAFDGKPFATHEVIVGGDYKKPDQARDNAWYEGRYRRWTAATTPPHGYRSAVAYNPTQKSWITVGPNGTDLSTDDGRNWHPLRPAPADAPDADKSWNALSLPFVVGPAGRIGRLNPQP